MKTSFIPIDYSPFDYNGQNYMKIYGRDEKYNQICLIDSCPVFMWAILKQNVTKNLVKELIKEIKEIYIQTKERTTTIEKIEIHQKNFLGEKVLALKIFATNNKDLIKIASKLDSPLIDKRRGQDINFTTHYIIEKKFEPQNWYEIKIEEILEDDYDFIKTDSKTKIYKLIESKQINKKEFFCKSLSYDIETDSLDPSSGEILMISLYSKDFKKVITWKKSKTNEKYVEFVKNEKELLNKFIEFIEIYSPDFLIGYNSDSFDLPFIKKRAEILKIKIPLGLDKTEPVISKGVYPTTKINGISHIDLLRFVKTAYAQYMQSETLSLNDVAYEFLKEKKIEFKFKHSSKIKEDEWELYYKYNLQDSKLTYDLFNKFFPDLIEFSKVIKEPIFNISRNGLSKQIENYILHNLEKYNEIPEKKPSSREMSSRMEEGASEGAFVYEPIPGMYENLAMFDFTSMHTSIIITHNISKGTLTEDKKNSYESPEIENEKKKTKYYFKKEPGFFPLLLKEIYEKRKEHKKEYSLNPDPFTKARSNAFKVLSASAHGYVAFAGARYHSKEASQSILAFVRKYNKETIEKIKNSGYEVIYGDTDSVAFTIGKSKKEDIKQLLKKLNKELPGVMHLELEGFFKRGIWVTTRGGEIGAKKKYALISEEGNIKIRGFETVRRDWCNLARKTQDKILRLILNEGNEKKALEYTQKIIQELKERKISKEDLLIKTQLKKQISKYKSISPHVTAAIKIKKTGENVGIGSLIEYYIGETKSNSKLVRDKAFLKEENIPYDINYYLEKQIIPSVEQIFNIFKINIKEIIDGQKQENLKKWF